MTTTQEIDLLEHDLLWVTGKRRARTIKRLVQLQKERRREFKAWYKTIEIEAKREHKKRKPTMPSWCTPMGIDQYIEDRQIKTQNCEENPDL